MKPPISREVSDSYAAVRRIARKSGSSFYRSFWLLPRDQRDAMSALYAFARVTDDLGDCEEPLSIRRHWLDLWRQITAMNLIGDSDQPTRLASNLDDLLDASSQHLSAHALAIMPAIRHAAVSYTHLTLPTIYSV